MKVCPVCKSRTFDDMDICYGCMYRFNNKDKNMENNNKDLNVDLEMNFKDENDSTHIPQYFELAEKSYRIINKDIDNFLNNRLGEDSGTEFIKVQNNKTSNFYTNNQELKNKSHKNNKKINKTITIKIEIPKELISIS